MIDKFMLDQADRPNRRSIVVVVGLLMALVVGLGVAGMISSMVIAQISRGMATAINQSGTLRMQSYRVGVALADDSLSLTERQALAKQLANEYEQRLVSHRLTEALPSAANDSVRLAYERVRWRWVNEMRRAVADFVGAGADSTTAETARRAYLERVDDFVGDIHGLVRVLEERAERSIDLLSWIQAVALFLTVAVVLVTLMVVQRRIVAPLGELLRCADRARTGDFSARTGFAGADELGRLGSAMNLMTEGLSQIYNELEDLVAEKTRDLARTNHSLELLYRTSRTLDESPLSEPTMRQVLRDVRAQLHLAEVVLCLREGREIAGAACIGIGTRTDVRPGAFELPLPGARPPDCGLCGGQRPTDVAADQQRGRFTRSRADLQQRVFDFPVGDGERRFGILRVALEEGARLESWQRPLLESLAGHVATALDLRGRVREGRRLVLHEERSILARELHDSLAQSLSYLKIQATRLDAALKVTDQRTKGNLKQKVRTAQLTTRRAMSATPEEILAEIRTGISSAYRQLRELLTTFRLKMDGRGLGSALVATANEFQERGDLTIDLSDHMPRNLLSPNEEVHVLQIVREALSNVARHSRAQRCVIDLLSEADEVSVVIADDGVGCVVIRDGVDSGHAHYGTTIMRERALSLGGSIQTDSVAGQGTKVCLRFRPRLLSPAANGVASSSVSRH
ncbi:MAG: type IV pili methyl-accepting chemotaxis transducer N-terminal domain-containing protein [Thiohalocapsa sp.]